jgi:hypothetical protein
MEPLLNPALFYKKATRDCVASIIGGFGQKGNEYIIDRTKAGIHDFNKDFAGIFTAPRLSGTKSIKLL